MEIITRELALQVLAFLFPPTCLACRRVEGREALPIGLCSRCRRQLEPEPSAPPSPAHLAGSIAAGRGEGGGRSPLDRVLSGWLYQPPLDEVIHALKFGRLEFLGSHLAAALHERFHCRLTEIDVVVPIPLHWLRRVRRGYNQAEAIAAPLARRLERPLVRALRRSRSTRPQARLGRQERRWNVRLAFAPVPGAGARVCAGKVLLVDDVMTTGATLEEAAGCLLELGARSVTALIAGRAAAPRPDRTSRRGKEDRPSL